MTAEDLATMLATLRAAGVREATFHDDGRPARLVFERPGDPAPPPAPGGDPPVKREPPPGGAALWGSRMRPGAPQ